MVPSLKWKVNCTLHCVWPVDIQYFVFHCDSAVCVKNTARVDIYIKKTKAYNLSTNPLIPTRGEGDWNGWKVMKIILSRFNLFTGFNLSEGTRHELYSWESWWMFYLRARVNNYELSCLCFYFSHTFSIYRPHVQIATKRKTTMHRSHESNLFVYVCQEKRC